jgi:hypothetical protein
MTITMGTRTMPMATAKATDTVTAMVKADTDTAMGTAKVDAGMGMDTVRLLVVTRAN